MKIKKGIFFKNIFRILGGCIIFIACLKLLVPFLLPITLNEKNIETLVKTYYQNVNIGSAHFVWHKGAPHLLLQDVSTKNPMLPALKVRRLIMELDWLKSVWAREIVLKNLELSNGSIDLHVNPDSIRTGLLEIPLHSTHSMPAFLGFVTLKNIALHVETPSQQENLFVHSLQLKNAYPYGQVKASLSKEPHKKNIFLVYNFTFEENEPLKGLLYIKADDQNLQLFSKLLKKIPFEVAGELDFEMWNTVKGFEILQSTLHFDASKLYLKSHQEDYYIDSLSGVLAYNRDHEKYQVIGNDFDFGLVPKTSFLLETKDLNTFFLKGSNINVEFLHFLVKNGTPIAKSLSTLALEPYGSIPYFEATIDKELTPSVFLLEGVNLGFVHSKVKAYGLNGKFLLTENIIQAELKGQNLFIPESAYFRHEIIIPRYQINLVHDLSRQTMQSHNTFALSNGDIEQRLHAHLQNDSVLSLEMHANTISVEEIKTLIPSTVLNPSLEKWLDKSLKSGNFSDLTLKYSGEVKDLSRKNATPIMLKGTFHNLTLDYAPLWPVLSQFEGQLCIDNHQLHLQGKGALPHAQVTQITASIQDLRTEPANLQVETKIQGDLKYGWDVLHASTLLEKNIYKMFEFRGNSLTNLHLNIPLIEDKKFKTQYHGNISFGSSTAQLPKFSEPFQEIQGVINFHNDQIKLEDVTAKWLNNPLQGNVVLTLAKNPQLTIQTQGILALSSILDNAILDGNVPFTAAIDWYLADQNFADAQITADLTHVESTLPKPFDNLKSEGPLKIQSYFKPDDQLKMRLNLAKTVTAALKFDLKPTTGMRFEAGHIHFGDEDPIELSHQGWKIDGVLDKLHLTDWFKFKKNFPTNPRIPIELDLFVHALSVNKNHFSKMNIQGLFSVGSNQWQMEIHSPQLEASISLPLDAKKAWEFTANHLILENTFDWEDQYEYPRRPLIFSIKKLQRPGMKIKDFNLQLLPLDDGYAIHEIRFKTNQSEVEASGFWTNLTQPHHVKLGGTLKTQDIHEFLLAVNKPSSIREAQGTIDFDVSFKGDLLKPELDTFMGQASIDLKSGYIQGVNPGFGKILSLLSLDNIERRLRFDFGDITQEGFSFDKLAGRAQLNQGKIRTEDFLLESSNANILFNGEMGILDHKIEAEMVVMPNVTSSLPLAAAIAAGNPAVGAAVWLMDKILGPKIQEIVRYGYFVTGTLENPHLKAIPSNTQMSKR